jgi:hypothetical protein
MSDRNKGLALDHNGGSLTSNIDLSVSEEPRDGAS